MARQVRVLAAPTAGLLVITFVAALAMRPDAEPSIRLTAGRSALAAVIGATRATGTARLSLTLTGTMDEAAVLTATSRDLAPATGDGVVDFRTGHGRVTLDYGRGQRFETKTIAGVTYVKYPSEMRDLIRVATPWVTIRNDASTGDSPTARPFGVPDEAVRALERAGNGIQPNFREVGREEVRGEQTLHYRDQQVPTAPREGVTEGTNLVEVWVDFDGVLRRVRTVTTEVRDIGTLTTVSTYEYYDFGVTLRDLAAPPSDQVTEITDLDELIRSGAAARRYPEDSLPKYCEGRALLAQAAAREAPDLEGVRAAITAIDEAIEQITGSSASDNAARSRMRALNSSARVLSIAIRSGDGPQVDEARARVTTTLGSTADPC
jgi:hypothetical protein